MRRENKQRGSFDPLRASYLLQEENASVASDPVTPGRRKAGEPVRLRIRRHV